ncbi:DUF4190 domain-containing protein [Streptomyces solaniscabiei]|uniref:DUF4190 domain-containing protein n=1 Tax=Streptomyces solaniscabiei TaxID=2683255 RepID=UPI001CE34265|nr:DUF4190 domain-containing protein [Streptomyces solaniscabiei]
MSDDAQPPRADAQAPEAAGNDSASRPNPPGAGSGGTWAGPAGGGDDGIADAAPKVGLDKPDRSAGNDGRPAPAGQAADAGPGADPWAAPAGGPGDTLASNGPAPWPAPSVHDQRAVTSMPAAGTQPPPWVNPGAAAPADGTTGPFTSPGATTPPSGAGPFAPPGATTPPSGADPFAPPGATTPPSGVANPFAAPGATGPASSGNPFAPPGAASPATGAAGPFVAPPYAGQDQAVPPPPIAPDGPGQVPYGYPVGHGYPGQGGYAGPQPQGYYGWPGMAPMPSNGMGTAGLVLGIVSAVVFCLWPLAIVLGVLGVVFGALGRGKARGGEATNPGQALAGIICGAVGIVLGIGFGALVIFT